jgi:hypothetical protein
MQSAETVLAKLPGEIAEVPREGYDTDHSAVLVANRGRHG